MKSSHVIVCQSNCRGRGEILEKPFHIAFHFVQVIPVSFKFNVGLQIPFVTAFARPPQWMEVGATFCAETLTLFCILLTSICDVASCLGLMKVLNLDISNKDCHFYTLPIYTGFPWFPTWLHGTFSLRPGDPTSIIAALNSPPPKGKRSVGVSD